MTGYFEAAPGMEPTQGNPGDSGWDVRAREGVMLYPGDTKKIDLGLRLLLPPNYEAQLRPRSSMSAKGILCHTGTIDQGYRGPIAAVLTNLTQACIRVEAGDRVAQLVLCPVWPIGLNPGLITMDSVRGEGGFGSTGR